MDNIKAIFFDIDGTFFDHKSVSVLDSTWEACRKLKENGYKVVLCTGRPKALVDDLHLLEQFSFDGFIGSNGALVLDADWQVLYADTFSVEKARELFALGKKHGLLMQTLGDNSFISEEPNETAQRLFEHFHIECPPIKAYEDELLTNINVFGEPQELLRIFQEVKDVRMFVTSQFTIDFAKMHISKASGIAKMMQYWGYDEHAYVAFGDSMNDVEMLKEASLGIAMKNSDPDLFAHADEICKASWENAIYESLSRHGFI